ncbi:signal peptide peptidase SppA [uncultured Fusobacterium sp.]|uniref:signal peptide peptidase SppA n=1 Tax=uncultured Fusobacterium sp. TaxID=159267 RepID=UPI0025F61187|nr:signal peptide peptidase SppA [uncultured Fusobacterium sp.]
MKLLKLLKKIIVGTVLFIIKEFFSFIIKLSLLLIIIGVIVGGIVKYSMKEEKSSIKSGSYVEIDLGKEYLEKIEGLPKFLLDGDMNFYSLLKRLDGVAKDARIEGVLLKIDNCTLDRAQIEELGEKIDSLKVNGKKVIAYGMDINNKNYSLALHAEQIFMPATMSANVNIIGYYNELAYYKGLADKLGIKFNVIHVGDYKSYGENFVKKEMSKEYKENIIRLQDKIYNNFLENVASRRKIDKKLINERILAGDFVFSEPYQMEKYNLIDGLKYEEDLKEMIGRDKIIPISNYQEIQKISKNKIAVIYAEGNIVLGEEKGNFGQSITPNKIILELERARKDKNIKGIVLRINSPGGSALASNIINRKIKEVGKEKPVYVSIGGVAASGGYYIAVAGDKIYAEKESLTGSIGVVSLIPNFKELLGKIDVNVEVVKKGEYSDLFSLSKEFTEKDEEKIYASSLKVYSEFLDVVAQGRKLDRNYVHSIAQGKVWLGEEGKELGLVDGIGGLETTISSLAKDLDLVDYMSVEIVEEEKIDSIIKGYLPFKVFSKELYFKPIYFFPYNI